MVAGLGAVSWRLLLFLLLGEAQEDAEDACPVSNTEDLEKNLVRLRKLRNSQPVLDDVGWLYSVTRELEKAMTDHYGLGKNVSARDSCNGSLKMLPRPGNLHDVKGHAYYVGAISEVHPSFPPQAVQSIVASEWYHPGLTAKSVWCVEDCTDLPLAARLDRHFPAIQKEVERFWTHPEVEEHIRGVGSHTTRFDRMLAGNGTWVDVRLWRGRAFDKKLCERHFRVLCSIIEASPEVWTNPWSHVLLSVLLPDSWVPFHQGHTNGQLTYHLPVMLPDDGSVAELAVVKRGGSLNDSKVHESQVFSHPEESTVAWKLGKTLVFDDSFTHAVRYRMKSSPSSCTEPNCEEPPPKPRVVLLMRGWHPELELAERAALRDFIRRGGEEDPAGYEMLPISQSPFGLSSS